MGNSFFKGRKADEQKQNKVVFDEVDPEEVKRFSGDFMQDCHYLKQLYSYPINIDFMVREFTIDSIEKRAILFFIPSMTDTKLIEERNYQALNHHESCHSGCPFSD